MSSFFKQCVNGVQRRAKQLARRLDERGHGAVALQGNMSQGQRERALEGFRTSRYDVLVATDIAARGLDIQGVSHVVNFDVPRTPDAYTHRIGRTGRAERAGTAFTFVTNADAKYVRAIEQRLGAAIERRRLSELGRIEVDGGSPAPGRRRERRNGRARAGSAGSRPTRASSGSRARRPKRELTPSTPEPARPVVRLVGPTFGAGVHDGSLARRNGGEARRPKRRRRRA